MRIEAFIQARMGSTRLPGKILKPILEKPLLDFLIERLMYSKGINEVVVLTTREIADDPIVTFCEQRKIPCFRGSEEDVLDRYYQAALLRRPDGIVRITSDCPLIDPQIVDQLIEAFRHEYPKFDYVSNTLERTFPRGLDAEVFSFEALERAFQNALYPEEHEHVTVYMYRHPELFKLKNIAHTSSLAHHRWTVDTPEDFALIRLILENLYPVKPQFRLNDILDLLSHHSEWIKLNAHIEQKKLPLR
jgi:spore coat polysaccharide biosynthesis protein SpsF